MPQAVHVHRAIEVLQRRLNVLLFVVFLGAILPFVLLALYAHPSADDYCYGSLFRQDGFWAHIKGEYLGWKGRYTAIFFTVLFHQAGGILVTYGYAMLLLLAALLAALFVFTRSALENAASTRGTLLPALGLAALYLGTMPKAPATLYWLDGAMQYQLGGIFSLLAVAALLALYRAGRAVDAALACLFIFLAIGCTELAMITLVAVAGAMAFSRLAIHRRDRLAWTIVVAVTAASSALLVLAPGNFVRAGVSPEGHDFWLAFRHATYYGGATLADWLASPGLWLATAAFTPAALRLVHLGGVRAGSGWPRLAVTAGLLPALVWSSFFALWWAAETNPPGRALNMIYLIFVAGWFLAVLEIVAAAAQRFDLAYTEEVFSVPLRAAGAGVAVLLAVFLLLGGDARVAYADLLYRASAYDQAMKHRYAIVARRKQQEHRPEVVLPRLQNPPRILVYSDIQGDRKDWRNGCFARYFGIKSVVRQ